MDCGYCRVRKTFLYGSEEKCLGLAVDSLGLLIAFCSWLGGCTMYMLASVSENKDFQRVRETRIFGLG